MQLELDMVRYYMGSPGDASSEGIQPSQEANRSDAEKRLLLTRTCTNGTRNRQIEELKSKDKIISQLERQLGHSATTGASCADRWSPQAAPAKGASQEETTLDKGRQHVETCGKNGAQDSSKSEEGLASNAFHLPPIEDTCDRRRMSRVPSLERRLEEEERQTHALTEKNAILMKRLSEMERRSKPLQDRSKKYVEKSMELTSVKRCLEDQLKSLTEDNQKLKEQCEQSRRKLNHVTRQLTQERSDKEGLEDQTTEIEDLHKQLTEQSKTIAALKQTCSEKDRRIELIQYRKKRRRQERSQEMLAGVKETSFGYDEDNQSVDSELSSLSLDNSLEDDSWDEFAKEEFQQNYRRLAREHLDLEKSYALLQSHSDLYQDPERENKSRSVLESDLFKAQCKIENLEKFLKLSGKDSKWLDEKQKLQTDNKELGNKVQELQEVERQLRQELDDSREREEELEFKFLELEESDDRDILDQSFANISPLKDRLTNGVNSIHLEEILLEAKEQEIDFQDLVQQMEEVINHMDKAGSDQSKLALLKAHAFLGILDKTLKNSKSVAGNEPTQSALHRDEKLLLDSSTTTTTTTTATSPVVLSGHSSRGLPVIQDVSKEDEEEGQRASCSCDTDLTTELTTQLTTAQKRIVKLENVFEDVSKAVEVYKDRLNMADGARERDKEAMETLRAHLRQIADNPTSGGQILRERLDKLEQAEKRADDLEKTAWELQSKVITLQQDKHALEERLEGSEHGRIIILAEDTETQEEMEKLRAKATTCEKAETEVMEKNLALEKEIHDCRSANKELTAQVDKLNGQLQRLRTELDALSQKHGISETESETDSPGTVASLQDEISHLRTDLEEKNSEINHLKNLLFDGDVLEQIRQLGQEMGVIKEENITLRMQLQGKGSPTVEDKLSSLILDTRGSNSQTPGDDELRQDLDNANALIEQLRKKLRLAEDTINDLESSEGELRDNLEVTEKKEVDYRKRIGGYQRTIRELRDQLADRDIIEESLQEKLNSLVNLEAAQSKRISELESLEASLRHRLDLKDEIALDFDLVASLEAKVEELQSKNHELTEKVEELEESETILQKNWKAVAEEDTSRIMLLEEKVRTLDLTNYQLKNKLREDEAEAALIDEMVFSSVSTGPKFSSRSESNLNQVGRQSPNSDLSGKIEELENKLQLVTEEKNSKIESLQEKLDDLRETEIKLSETVYEMEQEEKHLRAKLALYENSVVTVENMARYEDKLEEMKSSEHDLLDRMNSLENREFDLTDKLEQTESKYKSEVDKLERNISNYQKLEEKLLDKIHDLETKNKELEKKSKQPKVSVRDVSRKPVPNPETERQMNDLKTRVRELRAKVSSLEKQNKDLQEKLSTLNKEREELLVKNSELKSRLSNLEYLEKKVEVLQDAEAKFSDRVSELEEANAQLEQRLSSQELRAETEKQESASVAKSALFEKNQQLKEENQNLSLLVQRHSMMQVDSENLREKVTLLEKAEDKLMERVMELEEAEEHLKLQLARAEKAASVLPELQNKLDSKEDATESLQGALRDWQDKYNTLREEMASIENVRSKDKQKISMLLATEENLTEALTVQQKRERKLEQDLETSEEKVEELEMKVQLLQGDVDTMRSELTDLEQQRNDSTVEELQAELEATQEKLEEVQTEYEQTIEELENQGREQREEYVEKINELIEIEKTTKQTLQQETALKVNALHAKIDDVSCQLEKQLELNRSREEVVAKLTSENTQQKDKISQLEMLVDALKSLQPEQESGSGSRVSGLPDEESSSKNSEPKRYQSKCSFTFLGQTASPQPLPHQGSFDNRTAEGSETESQTHAQLSHISPDSSLDELLQERERLLIEIEELKHALELTQAQADRLHKITIEETKSEFITKEIIYRAKVDQLSGRLDKESNSSRSHKPGVQQNMAALRDTVDELQKREVLYCREIESMRNKFHRLRQTALLPKGPVIDLPHKKYSEMSQRELVETVQKLEGEITLLHTNLEHVTEEFQLFREGVDESTDYLRKEVLGDEEGSTGVNQNPANHPGMFSEAEFLGRVHSVKSSGLPANRSQEDKQNLSNLEYETLVMELRDKVDTLQEKESRLKRRLYEKSGIGPNTQVRKLYDRIIDLEASESKLQRKVEYLRLSEEDLHRRLAAAQKIEPASGKKSVLLTSVLPKRDTQKEELQVTVEQLQKNESSLNQRIEDLQKKNEDLTQKVRALQGSENCLKRRLEATESEDKGDNTMLEKPDEVLTHRVQELEKIEKQLKKQVSDLEQDREELRDLVSREKTTVHEQSECIRELQLSQKAFKDQVNNFELAERLFHVKIQNLEDEVENLEDKLKLMNANEGKYQEILKKYKLDGELHAAKSENMVATVEELSVSETALKKRVQQLEMENCEIAGKSESLDKQLKDVEDAKTLLNRHLREAEQEKKSLYDQINSVQQLEGTAQQRNEELAKLNQSLSNKIHKLQEEKAGLVYKLSQSQIQIEELERKMGTVRESELKLQHEVSDLEKCEQRLHKEVKEFRLREIDSKAKLREMEQEMVLLKDQLTKLRHRETTLRYRVQELENANAGVSFSNTSMDLDSSAQFRNYQDKILGLTQENEKLKAEMEKRDVLSEKSNPESPGFEEVTALRQQLDRLEGAELRKAQLEQDNEELRAAIQELQQNQTDCGHEEEVKRLRERLDAYNDTIQRLQKALEIRNEQEKDVNTREISEEMILPEVDRKRETSVPMAAGSSSESRKDAIAGIIASLPQEDSDLIVRSLRNSLSEEEVEELMQKVVSKTSENKEMDPVIEEEQWQKVESMNFDPLDDTASEDSHWGRVESAQRLNQSPSKQKRSKGTGHEEIGMDITLNSEQSQNDSDTSAHDMPRTKKSTKTVSLFKNKAQSNRQGIPPPLPSSLPPSLPTKGEGPITGLSAVDFAEDSCDSADEVPDFDTYDEAEPPLRAKPAPGLRGDGGSSGEITAGIGTSSLVSRLENVQRQLIDKESGKPSDNSPLRWRKEAEENARRFRLSDKDNKNLKEQINKLEQEVEEKTRHIQILEALLRALDSVMAARGTKSDEEIAQQVGETLEKTKSQVRESKMTSHPGVKDTAALITDLHQKERDLVSKCNEASSLKKEVRKWQDEYETVEQMRVTALDCLRSLEVEVLELQGCNEELRDVKEKYNKTQQELTKLEQRCSQLDNIVQEKELCVKENEVLKNKLEDYGNIEGELSILRGRFEVTENALKDRMESEKGLTDENEKLNRKVSELEKDLREKSDLLSEMETLKSRCDDLEADKQEIEKEVTTLQTRVADLTKQCQEKDETIQALSAEVEKLKVKEDKLPLDTNGLNGSVSSPDISFQDEEIVSSTHRPVENERPSSGSSVSLDGLPARSASVDPTRRKRRMLPTARSLTPTPLTNGHARAREARFESRVTLQLKNGRGPSHDPNAKTFVAVANYNPSLFSRSNRPRDELKLHEGDTVYVRGEKDDQGYYEAEVNGETGLVPASYLLPLPIDRDILRSMVERRQQQLQRVPAYLDQSPEQILQLHNQLQQTAQGLREAPVNEVPRSTLSVQLARPRTAPPTAHEGRRQLPQVNGHGSISPRDTQSQTSQTLPRLYKPVAIQARHRSLTLPKKKAPVFQGPPSPPRDFIVDRVIGDHSIMLSWQPPELDEFARSNGSELSGYVIYLNGRVCKKLTSPHLSKVVIENVDIDDSLKFLIQSLAVNGQASSLVEAVWDQDHSFLSESSFEGESETDLSSVLSSVQYDQGHQRAFLAIYDYSPMEHSPHDYTGCELGFLAGETITVYGRLRPDGFYHGEINGKRGLVPASFIEEVPHGVHTKQGVSRTSLKLTSQRNH